MRSRRMVVSGVVVLVAAAAVLTTVSLASAARPEASPVVQAAGVHAAGASNESAPSASAVPSAPATSVTTPSTQTELASFDRANRALIAKGGTLNGRAFVDNLVAAGFKKSDMQLTADMTTVGLKADNIEFSVLVGSQCLIGQYGVVGYASTVQPELATHDCLIGNTRSINW